VIKVVTFFLIGMVILALMGRLRLPKLPRARSAKCKACGRPRIGKGPCDCGREG